MTKLLTRNEFRKEIFERDNMKCVMCKQSAQDAHHIMERRLFVDGGYYLNNGASVCGDCHIKCEATEISPEQLREKIGILSIVLPEHLYSDEIYDKWGNIILSNGNRLRGELFYDESVQKILKPVLHLFTSYVKYPRTYHLPWSENMNDDDKMIKSMDMFIEKEIVVTEKMDGENTTLYNDYIHARSIDSRNHETRNWVKNFWSSISYNIPIGWRICGENMYAKHSIEYNKLDSYFLGFSIWNDKNVCLNWKETQEWFALLGIVSVPVLYKGIYDESIIRSLYDKEGWKYMEGYVIRLTDTFSYGQFRNSVGKFVRKNHIQTAKHWMHGQRIEKNSIKI